MGTVREWLEQNNLEKYARNFEEEEFDDLDSLKHMTLDDLSTVVKLRGAQAKFRCALEKKFGTDTTIHKQLTPESKQQTPIRAPMAEGNGLQAFELPQIFQGFSKGSATNKEVPLVETVGENSELINGRPNNSTGQTGYLQNMLAYISGPPAYVENWITKTLKPILYRYTKKDVQRCLLYGYDSPADLLADIKRKLISIRHRGWRWLCANWKEVCVVILALIAFTILVLVLFGYIPVPAMLSSALSASPTPMAAVSSAPAQVSLGAAKSSEFNGVMQTVYAIFNSNYNLERSFVGLGFLYN